MTERNKIDKRKTKETGTKKRKAREVEKWHIKDKRNRQREYVMKEKKRLSVDPAREAPAFWPPDHHEIKRRLSLSNYLPER